MAVEARRRCVATAVTVAVVFVSLLIPTIRAVNGEQLLLISLDGFPHTLLNESLVPRLFAWSRQGVTFTNGLRSQFLTYTLPNHVSIVTGLQIGAHGVVANRFFDTKAGEGFDVYNETKKSGVIEAALDPKWWGGVPIWLMNEAEARGRRSAVLFWPGAEGTFLDASPHTPTLARQWTRYRTDKELEAEADEIVHLFTQEHAAYNFVAWYIGEPDHTLHQNGFENGELRKTLARLDRLFGFLLDKIQANPALQDTLNVIVTADHGHAEIRGPSYVFCLGPYLKETGPVRADGDLMLYLKDAGEADQMADRIRHDLAAGGHNVEVFTRATLPDYFGYDHPSRVGDIILMPSPGWAVSARCNSTDEVVKQYAPHTSKKFNSSTHGMSPDDYHMRGVLAMKGPAFERALQLSAVPNNTDLFPLMAHLLDIHSLPKTHGRLDVLLQALRQDHLPNASITTKMSTILMILILSAVGAALWCRCRMRVLMGTTQCSNERLAEYRRLPLDTSRGEGDDDEEEEEVVDALFLSRNTEIRLA